MNPKQPVNAMQETMNMRSVPMILRNVGTAVEITVLTNGMFARLLESIGKSA